MVAKTYIERNLRKVDQLFRGSTSPHEGLLLAKLATLELCGWIEVSMDDIAVRLARRLLREAQYRKQYEEEVVKRVHGFHYDSHFKRLLRGVVGLQGVRSIERAVDRSLFDPMCGALSALKAVRDTHAHTYLKGVTIRIDAPSVTLGRCQTIYAGLRDIEAVTRKL